ncbi:MAG: aldo/keto reductase [Myxococcota bacterium]|nr:aldo/keto reductase [Myxococcota bacterium]
MPYNWTLKATRRNVLHYLGMATLAGRTLLGNSQAQAAASEASDASGKAWPTMTYRDFGKTGFRGSRLVFGCGAALSGGPRDELLDRALDAGVNVFDVGTRRYYKNAEMNLKPFLAKNRDRVFLISKASPYIDIEPNEEVTAAQAREGAKTWTSLLNQSLSDLGVDQVDAYYIMGAHNPSIIRSDELYEAFLQAKKAGKTRFWGLSTHQNAQNVLNAAAQTKRYALAQIAITPAGWYSWADKNIEPNSPDMVGLEPVLENARSAGIGLIGMKAGRFLAGRKWLGWGNPDAFDHIYGKRLMKSDLNTFQRSYAYVLEHGLDAVNADMQSLPHLEQNFAAAATAQEYFA